MTENLKEVLLWAFGAGKNQYRLYKTSRHIGVIMDGNGRWATHTKSMGHRYGAQTLKK